MVVVKSILLLMGNLALLLHGMALMSSGVQKSASDKLQHALALMTTNRFTGILTGIAVTAVIQSSGATTVMVLSFINAGLLTLTQSVGVIFGANIGTTVTAWIVSLLGFNFKISLFALPIFGAGFFLTVTKKSLLCNLGEALMGFGLLFIGLEGLGKVFTFKASDLQFLENVQNLGVLSVLTGFVIGIVITMVMHSSSAFTAIVITLAFNGAISWETSAAMTLGSNIGSTVDSVLGSITANSDARRSAFIHVFFNVVGAALGLILFVPLLNLVATISGGQNIAIRISVFHTIFNVATTIILTPFISQIVALANKIIKEDKLRPLQNYHLKFRDENTFGAKENAAMYIAIVEKELSDMATIAYEMYTILQTGFSKNNKTWVSDNLSQMEAIENYCDQMHEQLVAYIIECQKLPITEKQRLKLSSMIQITDDLEAITDDQFACAMMIKKSIEKKMKFSSEDREKLIAHAALGENFMQFMKKNINTKMVIDTFKEAQRLEDAIDDSRDALKKVVRKKLESGGEVKSELLYLDIVSQIEKIGDWAFSIASLLR